MSEATRPEALRLSGVRAGYGETVVLEDVGFTLAERGSLAILGRNGVGKTTLLATIMGHTTFHAGSIEFNGRSVSRMAVHQRNRIGKPDLGGQGAVRGPRLRREGRRRRR